MPTMNDVLQCLQSHFDANDWSYETITEPIRIRSGFSLDHPNLDAIRLNIRPIPLNRELNGPSDPCRGILVSGSCNVSAGPAQRAAVAEFITRANYGLLNGTFEMDYSDGEIGYRSYLNCEDQLPGQEALDDLIGVAGAMFDRYAAGLLGVIFGNQNPEEAIEACGG